MLASGSLAAAALVFPRSISPLVAASGREPRFRIGACDWSIGKHSDPGALELGKRIGLDGVQVSLGTVANNMHLREPEVRERYREAARKSGVAVASLAIGELNNVPYKSDPRGIEWVRDSIDVAVAMETNVVLLAFFRAGDLRDDEPGRKEVVRRLKEVAPKAEEAGVILGIESYLSAEDHKRLIDAVGSPAVKVYYDVANSNHAGYDIYEEIRWLGKENICEFHMKENGFLLGEGRIDFARVRAAIDDIDYRGWMQIEGAVPPGADMFESYVANRKFLQTVFRTD